MPENPTWSESGAAGAIAFLWWSVTTEWLQVLPPVPEGAMTEYVAAAGVVIAAIGRAIRWAYRNGYVPLLKPQQ